MANKLKKGTTAVGEIIFANILKPEEFKGQSTNKFSLMLKLSEKDKKKLLAEIEAEWQKFVESEEGSRHNYKYEYANGLKEYKEDEYFKFKMTHIIHCNTGRDWERHVPIFDAQCNEISNEVTGIGNGSKGKVAYELAPFYVNDKNYGVALRMTGIQILDLVEEGSASASSLGFGQEEGFVKEEEDNNIEIPFETEEGEDF